MVPRAKAWSLTSTDDLGGFSDLSPEEQEQVSGLLAEALEIVDKKEASPAKSSKKGKGGKKPAAATKKCVGSQPARSPDSPCSPLTPPARARVPSLSLQGRHAPQEVWQGQGQEGGQVK